MASQLEKHVMRCDAERPFSQSADVVFVFKFLEVDMQESYFPLKSLAQQ